MLNFLLVKSPHLPSPLPLLGRSDIAVVSRSQGQVKVKQKEVEKQTAEVLLGQNKLGLQRRTVRDMQAQLLEVQESKKAAVTGIHAVLAVLGMYVCHMM